MVQKNVYIELGLKWYEIVMKFLVSTRKYQNKFYVRGIDLYVLLRLHVQNRRRKMKSAAQFQHVP